MPVIDLSNTDRVVRGPVEIDAIRRGSALVWERNSRASLAVTDGIGTSAHSLLDAATGATDPAEGILNTLWAGDIHQTFLGWSSLADRWALNGPERTEDYDGTLIVAEIGDLETGIADPASSQGQQTLQYLYWYALTAQAKGCRFFSIYSVWPPAAVTGSAMDALVEDSFAKMQYWREWLEARPEITIPVYIIPTAAYIAAARALYDPASIYRDVIHLDQSLDVNDGLGWFVWMFLRGRKAPDDAGRSTMLQELIDAGWDILRGPTGYEMAGLGGAVTVTAHPVASNPLPSPLPLPGEPAAGFISPPWTPTTRSVHSGHSLTDSYIYGHDYPGDLLLLRNSLFDPDDYTNIYINRSTIPGSPMSWRWNSVPDHDARVSVGSYDSLMITEGGPPPHINDPYLAESTDYLCRFAANMIENGAGNEVIVWSIWPALTGPGTYPETPIPTGYWAGMTFRTGLDAYWDSFKYMVDYTTWKMHQEYPSLPSDWRVRFIPGDRWMARVYDDIQADLVPGITDIQDMFSDDIHTNDNASYGLSCFVMSCLWQIDLREQTGVYVPAGLSTDLRDYFWDLAWELAHQYEPIGMGGTEGAELVWDSATDADPLPAWTLQYPDDGPAAPSRPSAPTVSGITDESAIISWSAPSDNGSAITSYTLDWRPEGGSTTSIIDADSPETLSGLDSVSSYEVRVTAINAIGASAASPWALFTTTDEAPVLTEALVEITPTAYSGPTLDNALPAAAGGFRAITLSSGDDFSHYAAMPEPVTGAVYMIAALRWVQAAAQPEFAALTTTGWINHTALQIRSNGYINQIGGLAAVSSEYTELQAGYLTGDWMIVEVWASGTTVGACVDGGTDLTETLDDAGWSFPNFGLGRGSSGTFDLAALRILDEVPADRAAQRAWAESIIP